MPFVPTKKQAPGAAGTATEGIEQIRSTIQERADLPVSVSNTPTVSTDAGYEALNRTQTGMQNMPRTAAALDPDLATIPPDDAVITKLATHVIGTEPDRRIEVSLERIDSRAVDGTSQPADVSVIFDRPAESGGYTEIRPSDVPELIDALIEIYYAAMPLDPDVAFRMAERLRAHSLVAIGTGV